MAHFFDLHSVALFCKLAFKSVQESLNFLTEQMLRKKQRNLKQFRAYNCMVYLKLKDIHTQWPWLSSENG